MLGMLRICTSEKTLACGTMGLGGSSVQLTGCYTEALDLVPNSTKINFKKQKQINVEYCFIVAFFIACYFYLSIGQFSPNLFLNQFYHIKLFSFSVFHILRLVYVL